MIEERLTEDDLRRIIDGEYTDREARDADWLERACEEIQALREHIAKLEKKLRGTEGKLTLAEVVIGKYKNGELLPDSPVQTSSTADSDIPPAKSKEAADG